MFFPGPPTLMRSPDAPAPPPPSSSAPPTAVTSPVCDSSSKSVTSNNDWASAEFNLDSMFNAAEAVGDTEEGNEGDLDVSF